MVLPKPKGSAHQKRLRDWQAWLKNFQSQQLTQGKKVKFIQDAAWLLNDLYWRIAEQYLRPVLKTPNEEEEEHHIHPYKIISASEITIMMTEPIDAATIEEKKRGSAMLAWFVSTQILEGWQVGSKYLITAEQINEVAGYHELIDDSTRYPESFAAEHLKWLSLLNVTIEKPLLINAQCWRLFYISCLALANKGKLK
jgi:hypothetical protein